MRIYIYRGGERLVGKSGVGQAMGHQRESLRRVGIEPADHWTADTGAVHINTVLPDSAAAAVWARLRGKKVVWYGHSTMEDFRNSFKGSNLLAPLFRRWITFCYGLGDVVITPSEYSRQLLKGYGLRRPVYTLSNGVDTDKFRPDPAMREAFRTRYGLREDGKSGDFGGPYHCPQGIAGIPGACPPDAGCPLFLVRLDGSPADSCGDPPGNGGGTWECDVPGICGAGAPAGGLLRCRCVCVPQPRGDRGNRGAGGTGLRNPRGGTGYPRLPGLADGWRPRAQSPGIRMDSGRRWRESSPERCRI